MYIITLPPFGHLPLKREGLTNKFLVLKWGYSINEIKNGHDIKYTILNLDLNIKSLLLPKEEIQEWLSIRINI